MSAQLKREPPNAISDEAVAASVRAARHSQAWTDIGDARIEQIEKYGHTREVDDCSDWPVMARTIGKYSALVGEDISLGTNRNLLEAARRHAVKLAAMAIALIDRIDRTLASKNEEETER